MRSPEVLLIGSGQMAIDYWHVLEALGAQSGVVGRSEEATRLFAEKTGAGAVAGGIERYLSDHPKVPDFAIVAVGIEQLAAVTHALLRVGVGNILVEKPGALTGGELISLGDQADEENARVFIAYNRRFFASTIAAQAIIRREGGVRSFAFEFTEWSHIIAGIAKAEGVKERWLIGNSSHVIDLAFFLGGAPTELATFTSGALDWHPTAIFAGAGRTESGALFSYQANWASAGRWGVEVMLPSQRLLLRPMEKLQSVPLGKVVASDVTIDDRNDVAFKPGLYLQTEAFLTGRSEGLCSIDEQRRHWPLYGQIAGYDGDD